MNELHGSMIFDSFDQHGAVRLASFSGNLPSFGPGGSGYAAVMAPASGGLFAFAYLICLALRRRFF